MYEQLRRHFSDDMPTTPRPSVLSSPTAKYVTSPTPNYGHARRKSVLASLTRTFTSPTLSRKKAPLSMQSSQASIAEEELESAESHMSPSTSFPAANDTASPSEEQPHVNLSVQSPQLPILQSQLSNLSDYLSSLSSVAVIRGSRQWTAFFKPGKADHESARLGALPHLPRTMSKGKRLKRMKSEGGLETRSPMSSPPDLMPSTPHGMLVTTPERKEVRIDDSGIGVDSLGHYSSRHNGPLGRGHPTESSTNSSSATSHSASTHMQRVASDGTDTSVSSAMSVFVEHTDGTGQDTGVGDPEVLAYMERLRQESETRGTYTKIPLDVKTDTSRKEGKSSKSTIVEHIPTTSSFSASNMVGQDLNHTPPALLPDSLQHENPILSVPSLSDEPILSALEESMTAATPIYEAEEAHLPPLSGATIVASEGSPTQLVGSSSNEDMEQEHAVADYLSPTTAVVDNFDGSSTGPSSLTGRIPSLTGRKKRSTSSMRRCRKSSVANTSVSHRTGSHKPSVRIEDFEILRVLGKGCAGKVLLARLKDMTFMSAKGRDSSLYAIKAIHKHHVLAHRELAHTLTEQSILKKMATDTPNPFVVKMRWSFQVKDHCLSTRNVFAADFRLFAISGVGQRQPFPCT